MKFLVGFNGTDASRAALALAATYAKRFDASVIVVTSMGGGRGEKVDKIDKAKEDLAFAESYLKDNGIVSESHQLARGVYPLEDLVIFAEENKIDQIFVGIEKVSRTQKILLGSHAQYIILKAPCPVVTVKHLST